MRELKFRINKMKTFIWNMEYDVLAANAETVDEARELLRPKLDEILDPQVTEEIERADKYLKEIDPSTLDPGYYRDREWWDSNIKYIRNRINKEKLLLDEDPEVIIEENQANIFFHGNE